MSPIEAFVIASKPAAHFGAGAIVQLPALVRATGADQVVVVTDAALASTPVIATVQAVLADASIPARLFAGVHPNHTTDDLAAGADAVAQAAAASACWPTCTWWPAWAAVPTSSSPTTRPAGPRAAAISSWPSRCSSTPAGSSPCQRSPGSAWLLTNPR